MLHAFVPKFQLGNEFVVQLSDIDIVQFILPLQKDRVCFRTVLNLVSVPLEYSFPIRVFT